MYFTNERDDIQIVRTNRRKANYLCENYWLDFDSLKRKTNYINLTVNKYKTNNTKLHLYTSNFCSYIRVPNRIQFSLVTILNEKTFLVVTNNTISKNENFILQLKK